MSVKNSVITLLVVVIFHTSYAQILLCTYRFHNSYGYTCDIFIYNPSGTYNFSRVGGTHLTGKTNEDVRYILRTTDSNTTNIPYIICETFQNATRFELQSIRISRLDENAFWGCKSLVNLDLSNNLLTYLPHNVFSKVINVYGLPQSDDSFHLQKLETLYLKNNQIEEILPMTFDALVSLKSLGLNNNNISKINAKSFESMEQLTTLYLENNQLEEIKPKSFSPLINLKTLYLYNNRIKLLFPESFESLGNLTTLHLYYNQINEIPPMTFSLLVNLVELQLNNNNLSIIYADSFESLAKLQTLYLQYNSIEELPRNVFSSLKQLAIINLYNNKLKVIHSFGVLPNLATVNLQNNQIDAFDQDLIDDSGVKTLYMNNNLCANSSITDSTPLRIQMRMLLLKCFENYANLETGTTTVTTTTVPTTTLISTESSTTDITLPPGCIAGNLDERVCRLEDSNEEIKENIYNHDILINEFHDDMRNQSLLITDMQENLKNHSLAIAELEARIEELANRPCACN